MKKLIVFCVVLLALLVNSCTPVEEGSFQESFLVGKWVSGTVHYKYLINNTGATWDTADNVTEAEAQAFTWTLVKSQLTHIHIIQSGGTVPKIYTVTELTATSLKYKDSFGKTYSFIR